MKKRQGEVRTGRLVMLASALMFFYGFILICKNLRKKRPDILRIFYFLFI
ncbi:MAG: hypothetical protein HFI28_02915 [Lachnospiraceae bacterium]|nr:hypothetical protein [Lachnospiraceae bacterium]